MNTSRRLATLVNRKQVIRAALCDPDTVLLEASSAEEFDNQHLPGAQRLDYWHEPQQVEAIIKSPQATVILYSKGESLVNPNRAAKRLQEMGYRKLAIYAGGKLDWESGGLAFERTANFDNCCQE